MTVNSFRDLRVWQASMNLVEQVYQMTLQFPKAEIYGLTSQMRRAAVSVPSNIAEGNTRQHTKEYLNHLSMAQASLAELETQIEVAARLKYCEEDRRKELLAQASSVSKQLYALRNALLRKQRGS